MSAELFEHNRQAYERALVMLRDTGKAAIIHPTGTGKSFIGFQLCADFPEKTVLWLSPSEYIFRTQLENYENAGGEALQNVVFRTYARLMLTAPEALEELHPDTIILDEFHRCGAEQWGEGVQRLLRCYPAVPLLGLSATNIRYLDNQRDMADELFDGNIASEMTLGEAIVRGILRAPTYVISIYAYQQELERYEKRIGRMKNRAAADRSTAYLEALRRSLEQADGLDVLFRRHMTDRSGKYIAFCANAQHMEEMISHVPEWFGAVDETPHIYQIYSEDAAAGRVLSAFKRDESAHLKLLFCIDMLNEGIHVEGVSGVILFRPTVSPIIYKQQIGRALSAGGTRKPIILDIVNNFDNLYSIGMIEQEMRNAISYYHYLGERKIVTESFEIVDEVRDCRSLFEALESSLSASWDTMYEFAEAYYRTNGDLEVPVHYKTPEGYALGAWLMTQRKVCAGKQPGSLDETRIARLDAIGMVWNSYRDTAWERNYAAAKQYYEEHGDLNVKVAEVTADGVRLGSWLQNLRTYRKNQLNQKYLNKERIQQLDAIGMIWDQPNFLWEKNYMAAMEFYRRNGHLDIPSNYISEDGLKTGMWLCRLRLLRRGACPGAPLSAEQIQRLDAIGMQWEDKYSRKWEAGYAEAEKYFRMHGDLRVPAAYQTDTGYRLGKWISRQRESKAKLSAERVDRLDTIGMIWTKRRSGRKTHTPAARNAAF